MLAALSALAVLDVNPAGAQSLQPAGWDAGIRMAEAVSLSNGAGPFDHQMFTHKNGRRLMIAHPYSMSDSDAATLKALTNTLPLAWRDAGKEHDWELPRIGAHRLRRNAEDARVDHLSGRTYERRSPSLM